MKPPKSKRIMRLTMETGMGISERTVVFPPIKAVTNTTTAKTEMPNEKRTRAQKKIRFHSGMSAGSSSSGMEEEQEDSLALDLEASE
mmetsp:Transcript_18202/g.33819  ORF Transcript_18202/g.33819 Transcript_18202/m.33819 type:complete len:87 (+) Transcript_18202:891-1151(+)